MINVKEIWFISEITEIEPPFLGRDDQSFSFGPLEPTFYQTRYSRLGEF